GERLGRQLRQAAVAGGNDRQTNGRVAGRATIGEFIPGYEAAGWVGWVLLRIRRRRSSQSSVGRLMPPLLIRPSRRGSSSLAWSPMQPCPPSSSVVSYDPRRCACLAADLGATRFASRFFRGRAVRSDASSIFSAGES